MEPAAGRAAEQGWVLREVLARDQARLKRLRLEARRAGFADGNALDAWIARRREAVDGSHASWYPCNLSRDTAPQEVAAVLALARRFPEDSRAQESACEALAKASMVPLFLDDSRVNRARVNLVLSGLQQLLIAMNRHNSLRLQQLACQAVQQLAESSASELHEAVPALVSALHRHPCDEAVCQTACAALAKLVQHDADWEAALSAAALAMASQPASVAVQSTSCDFVWQLALRFPSLVAAKAGLHQLVSQAARLPVPSAVKLRDAIQWTSGSVKLCRVRGRRRWGQWTAGPVAAE